LPLPAAKPRIDLPNAEVGGWLVRPFEQEAQVAGASLDELMSTSRESPPDSTDTELTFQSSAEVEHATLLGVAMLTTVLLGLTLARLLPLWGVIAAVLAQAYGVITVLLVRYPRVRNDALKHAWHMEGVLIDYTRISDRFLSQMRPAIQRWHDMRDREQQYLIGELREAKRMRAQCRNSADYRVPMTSVISLLEREIHNLRLRIQHLKSDNSGDELRDRLKAEKKRNRRAKTSLSRLQTQLASPDAHVGFWSYLKWIEGKG
jgi:hypothetical protein